MILGNVHGYDSLRTNIQGMRNIGLKRLHSWPKTLNYWKWNTEEKYINSSFLLPENFLKPRVFPLAVQQGRCALFIFSMTQPHGWNPTWLHSERDAVKTPHCKWQIFLHSGVVCVCVCVYWSEPLGHHVAATSHGVHKKRRRRSSEEFTAQRFSLQSFGWTCSADMRGSPVQKTRRPSSSR